MDAGTETGETAPLQAFPASPRAVAADGGRWVDVEAGYRRDDRGQSRLISSHIAEPSVGLEPTTPSLPWRFSRRVVSVGGWREVACRLALRAVPAG